MPQMIVNNEGFHILGGDTTFSDHTQSELTLSSSAGWKKQAYMAHSQQNNVQQQSRLYASAGATTSEGPDVVSPPATLFPPFSRDLVTSVYSSNVETDDLVRLQMQRLESGIKVLKRKHSTDLLSVVQQQAVKLLRIKEVELDRVKQRNRELEQQVMQLSSESQIWFNNAMSAESVVSGLRAKLDHVLTNQNKCWTVDMEEGYSDSTADAESVCEANEERELHPRTACRVCREREVCVLLLPCRHLCLCRVCEVRMDTCPVCNSTRKVSIQVVVP